MRDKPVMMSSTIPSVKYSCSVSPLKFENGSTAIDGFPGTGRAIDGSASVARALVRATGGPT